MTSEKGFVKLWVIGALISLVVTAVLMPQNIKKIELVLLERNLSHSYEQLKDILNASSDEAKRLPIVFIFNQFGPTPLPEPFHKVVLEEGMVVDFIVRFWLIGFGDVRLLQVRSDQSHIAYRQLVFNGKSFEQTIRMD